MKVWSTIHTEENDIDEELVEMLITKAEKYARNTLGQKCTGTYLGKSKSYENPQYILIGCVNDANTLSVIYMMEHANGEWIPHSIRICSGDNAKDAFNTKVYININTN